jgi:glycosyltransferase involved in cell wall biosynthesis
VVGDYAQTAREKKINGLRDQLILQYNLHFDRIFRKSMRSTDIVVNSPALYRTYESFAKSIFQVRTTTLSAKDIFIRPDVFTGKEIHLLYTGRFDRNKGLFECLEAFRDLFQKHPQMRLNFVGWDASKDQSVLNQLKAKAEEYGVQHQVIFHGKKAVGAELNAVYQQSDIYLLASYHEGFPRTIWEAMANGLPVIATKVGAIPDYLRHEEDAMLIDPRNVSQIVDAVETLLSNELLRKKLIQNGYELAKQNTLEIQSKILLDRLLALKNKQISNEGTTIQ